MADEWHETQHQGRLAAIQRRTIGPIIRQAKQLDTAMLSSATPATYSRRFETMFRRREIKGVLKWGGASRFAHNKLSLQTVTGIDDLPYCDPGINPTKGTVEGVRWFHYGMNAIAGDCVALEEWIPPKELGKWRRRIAVFNTTTGMEITGRAVEGMKRVSDVEKLEI